MLSLVLAASGGAPVDDQTDFDLTHVAIGLPMLVTAVCSGLIALGLFLWVRAQDRGTPQMMELSDAIQLGARTFLQYEYSALTVVVLCVFVLFSAAISWQTGICYLAGAFSSMIAGYCGMICTTMANSRTTKAAEKDLNSALRVAFNAGAVMGLVCVSLATLVMAILLMSFQSEAVYGSKPAMSATGAGTSTVAIFARVGGGIFTKAADVGADLVGKNIQGIPEDDIRNPATIADNVGDNVGDVAGMGADLYSSFVGSAIASALLGAKTYGQAGVALPFWLCMSGIVAALIGIMTVRCEENATQEDLLFILRRAMAIAGVFQVGFVAVIVHILHHRWQLFGCVVIGLAAGLLIGRITEYFTSYTNDPTQEIARSANITAANVVISGLSVGMRAIVLPAMLIMGVIISCNALGGAYGVSLASIGLLSTLGCTLATDAYGPVADNAGGIAEMCHMDEVRKRTDVLDALGNTTAAIGKGFAVASAILTALALLNNFLGRVSVTSFAVDDQRFIAGIVLGGCIPYFFGGLTMNAVNKAAKSVVVEVLRQWRTIPGLAEGNPNARPDYQACVAMVSKAALHAMVYPASFGPLAPLTVGIGLGPKMLAGYIIGCFISGFMLGGMMAAAGGAWDNAKKYIEANGKKSSISHKNAVVGDTVGDPFKDTSGPAISILMKLTAYMSVVLSPLVKDGSEDIESYAWVAILILGLCAIFVPIWEYFTPESLRESMPDAQDGDGIKAVGAREADEQKSNANGHANGNGNAHAAKVETTAVVPIGAGAAGSSVEMRSVAPAPQPAPMSAAPQLAAPGGRAVTIHFSSEFMK